MAETLGAFEQAVLLAILHPRPASGGEVYGRADPNRFELRLQRDVSASAVYATLDRLKQKGTDLFLDRARQRRAWRSTPPALQAGVQGAPRPARLARSDQTPLVQRAPALHHQRIRMTPPRWSESLLRALLRDRDRDTISGDLLEEYRESAVPTLGERGARRWYRRQVARLVWREVRLPTLVGLGLASSSGSRI